MTPAVFSFCVTVVSAILGGAIAQALSFPLPWLLGPLLTTASLSFAGVKFRGSDPVFPQKIRWMAIPVIGVMIGSVVTSDILSQILSWWPSLLLILPFVFGTQLMNYAVLRRLGGYDKPTAFFAASPGGLVEAILIGEARGGDPALMSIQHLGRIAVTVTLVPIFYYFITGDVVGSAAGVAMPGTSAPGLGDAALLIACGVIGYALHTRFRFAASALVWPMILSAIAHATGLTGAAVPPFLIQGAQLVIGATIGLRFLGQSRKQITRAMGLSAITVALTLTVAFVIALAVSTAGIEPYDAVFLAFAPGGLVEMGLIAISLGASPIYVTLHHVVRITVAVLLSQVVFDRIVDRK